MPIDYYILLQNNFQTKSHFKKTNNLMFHNLPLLQKKKTYFQNEIVKQILYEDILNCLEAKEASEILSDPYA